MTGWLKLSEEQRRTSLSQAATNLGVPMKAVEKDWWVTLTLKALFQCKYKEALIFKGGTSLSKCWKLIDRFSEDIDIALDPAVLGIVYEKNPSRGYLSKLKKAGCKFTSTELKTELERQFTELGVPDSTIGIEAMKVEEHLPDTDPQTLLVHYKSLFDPNKYIADVVKVEVGVRSLKEPFAKVKIESLLNEYFPNPAYEEIPFEVTAVAPHKTFLEKLFLLHEKFLRNDPEKIEVERMSRHLYDLERMMDGEAGRRAIEDHDLYLSLIEHRRKYLKMSWVDYDTLANDKIAFIPPDLFMESFKKDYEAMQEFMIYNESLPFPELMERLVELHDRIRNKTVD
jgi:predicted nucleotidyltransferase component of viral defense system